MGFWWFGRKSAPADMRPFVPAWLTTAEAGRDSRAPVDAPLGEPFEQYTVRSKDPRERLIALSWHQPSA